MSWKVLPGYVTYAYGSPGQYSTPLTAIHALLPLQLKYVVKFSDDTTYPANPPLCQQVP